MSGARLPRQPFRVVNAGGSPLPFLHDFSSAVPSLAALEAAAQGNGALTFIPDSDGVVRRVPLMVRLREQASPSLTAEVLRVGQGQRNYFIKVAAEKDAGI